METVTLGIRDMYRPDAAALCRFFGTSGTLRDVLGTEVVRQIEELPDVPANLIEPLGVFNPDHSAR